MINIQSVIPGLRPSVAYCDEADDKADANDKMRTHVDKYGRKGISPSVIISDTH